MLWFASRKALNQLWDLYDRLDARVRAIEVDWKAQIAALENAADLYNRAAARAERSGKADGGRHGSVGVSSLEELKRRRGGV